MINYTQERVNGEDLVDSCILHYVMPERRIIKRFKDKHVFKGKATYVSGHFLVELKLKLAEG